MFGKRFSRALAVTTVASLVMAAAAFADGTSVDGDTTVNPNNISYVLDPNANQRDCADRGEEVSGLVAIRYQGSSHFTAGQAVTVTFTPTAGSGISVPSVNGTIPTPWTNSSPDYTLAFKTTVPTTVANGTYSVSVSASSATHTAGASAFSVSVACGSSNSAPVVTADLASVTVNEGSVAQMTGEWSDANALDNVTLTASIGSVSKLGTNAGGTWSWSYTPGDDTAQTVTITANDGTASSTATFSLVANNVAPSRTGQTFSFNPYTGVANASVSFSDPGWLDEVTAAWSGIAGTGTNPQGPRTGTGTSPLTGTFTASQTYTGCLTDAITVRVSDDDEGYFDHEFAAADTLGVRTAEFKAPIKEGTRNIAKLGNVIPVKLTVLDCNGLPVEGLTLSIRLVKGDSTDETEVGAVAIDATSVSGADSGNVMRYQDGFYMYNLATKGLATGVPFTIVVKDGSDIVKTALIELKK